MPAKIKQGKYVDSDGVQQDVVFIGAEKAIFDDNGTRLDNKLTNMSRASGLTAEDAEGILGTADANVNFQSLVDAIADKVMNELVTNSALTTQLANYVTKAMMSNVQVNDNNHVPTSGLVYGMNQDITELSSDMQSKSWDIDEVNSVDFSKLEIGSINASVAQSIGITDATDFFQVIRIPWSSPYPNQILLTLSGKQRMYYRACSNGTWETPKRLITNADLVSGYTESIDVQANSYTETTITHNMGVVPNIIVSLRALTGQIDRADALTALIQEVTSNTATVRVFNSGTVQSGVNLYWIALRK